MEPGPSLGAEDDVAGCQFLAALSVAQHRAAAQDEEHLLCPEMHVQPVLWRAWSELVQGRAHPGVFRTPVDAAPSAFVVGFSVPFVGEEVVACHEQLPPSSCQRYR